MKHTYKRPVIEVVLIGDEQIMAAYSNFNVTNAKDITEYKGDVMEKMDPSSSGPTASWNEKIWGQAD